MPYPSIIDFTQVIRLGLLETFERQIDVHRYLGFLRLFYCFIVQDCWCMKRAEFKQVLVHLYIFLQNVSAYAQEGQIFAKILKEV